MRAEHKIALVALLLVVLLELVALSRGIDGTMFAASTGTIGGICGYVLRGVKNNKK